MSSDAERVRGWLSRLDPASEQYPPIVVTRAIARLARPDRAAALQDVETLLRSVTAVYPDDASDVCGYFYVGRGDGYSDGFDLPAFAALIVDRVLGGES